MDLGLGIGWVWFRSYDNFVCKVGVEVGVLNDCFYIVKMGFGLGVGNSVCSGDFYLLVSFRFIIF